MHKTSVYIAFETLIHDIPQVVEYGLMTLISIYLLKQLRISIVPNNCLNLLIFHLNHLHVSGLKVKPKVILIPQFLYRR